MPNVGEVCVRTLIESVIVGPSSVTKWNIDGIGDRKRSTEIGRRNCLHSLSSSELMSTSGCSIMYEFFRTMTWRCVAWAVRNRH